MSQGLWDAHKSLAGELWADLLAQAGNPYMDVEKFRTIIETANTEHPSQKQHIGRARWLAFMNSKRVHEGEF